MKEKLIFGNFGIAYRYGNIIEINKVFKNEPGLIKKLIKHEQEHSVGSKMDFKHDFKDTIKFAFDKEMTRFLFKHPLVAVQSCMPIWYDKGWQWNYYLVVLYLSTFIMFYTFGWYLFGVM